MDKFSAFHEFETRETIIEESKLVLNIKELANHNVEITSPKIKLQSIDAEWWIAVGLKYTYCYENNLNCVPVKFHLSQKPNQVLDLQKCKFGVAVTEKDKPPKDPLWFQASTNPTWSTNPPRTTFANTNKTLVLDVVFAIRKTEITMTNGNFSNTINCCREILNINSKILKDPVFSDFKFFVKGKEFKVHKNILAAASPVFTRLFLSDLKESQDNVCTIEHIEPEIFEDLLHFIYEAKIPENLEENAKELYEAAHYYELELLKKICAGKVQSQLSVNNALDFYVMAYTYDLEELKKSAWDIVKRDVFRIFFRIKGEPLPPVDLHELIATRKSEQKFWENLKEDDLEESETLDQKT